MTQCIITAGLGRRREAVSDADDMSMTCPKCGLICPQDVQECDCGYNFETGEFTPRAKPKSPPGTSIAAYLVFVGGGTCCWGWMIFTLAERGLHPSRVTGALFFGMLLLLASGFEYSFLRLAKVSQWKQGIMLIQVMTLMAVAGSFAWQLGLSDEGVFISSMAGGVVVLIGIYWFAAHLNKKRGY